MYRESKSNKFLPVFLSILIMAFTLFVLNTTVAYGDHYTEEELYDKTYAINDSFIKGEMSQKDRDDKLAELKSEHKEDTGRTSSKDGGGLLASLSNLIFTALPLFIIYKWVTRRRNNRTGPDAGSEPTDLGNSQFVSGNDEPDSTISQATPDQPPITSTPSEPSSTVVDATPNQPPITHVPSGPSEDENKGFLGGLSEGLRDKTRDDLASHIKAFFANTVISERGRPEENIRGSGGWPGVGSLGIIDVSDNLIKWINVVRTKSRDRNGPARYRIVLGIPDSTVPVDHTQLSMKTVRKKSFPLFGKVIGVHWEVTKGNLQQLASLFSDDPEIDQLVERSGDMSIYTHPNQFQGWTIEVSSRNFYPMKDDWDAIKKIANHLITSPR